MKRTGAPVRCLAAALVVLGVCLPARAQLGAEAAAQEAGGLFDSLLGPAADGLRGGLARTRDLVAAGEAARKAAPPASGPSEKIIPRFQQKRFPAPAGAGCGLKSFTVMDYEVRSRDEGFERARISVMGAVIETTSPDCVRDYGVVQFIRGCVYHSRYSLETGAEVERVFDVARRLRGPRVVFNHPSFEVDQTQLDPLYVSYPEEEDRLALVYVPDSPLRLRSDSQSLLADMRAFNEPSRRTFLKDLSGPTSVTFVADVPEGGVSFTDEENTRLTASNSSLDFRTCVYRVADVPTSGDPAGEGTPAERGGPIQCFSWASRYTYDVAAQDFVTDRFQGVDPFCAQAPERAPLPGS